jgi:hypothetical protein
MGVLKALAVHCPDPPHKVAPEVPVGLSNLIMRLLEKDPDDRPAGADDVLAEIHRLASGTPAPDQGTEVMPVPRKKKAKSRGATRSTRAPRRRRLLWAGVLLGTLLVCGGAVLALALGALKPHEESWAVNDPARVYLSQMTPAEVRNWLDRPPHLRGGEKFAGVEVEGKRSPNGLFMHPPPPELGETTRLGYLLGKQYRTFQARVSLNDGPHEAETPVTFLVHGDGRLLWRSQAVRSRSEAQTCSVSVQGVDVLILEVECPGDPRGAHAVWIEPHVVR